MKRRIVQRGYQSPTPIDRSGGNAFSVEGAWGHRKTKPACFNGSYRSKGAKARRVPITLAQRA